jgi:hypothetical protein
VIAIEGEFARATDTRRGIPQPIWIEVRLGENEVRTLELSLVPAGILNCL